MKAEFSKGNVLQQISIGIAPAYGWRAGSGLFEAPIEQDSLIREFLTGARGPCHRFQRIHNEYTIQVSHSQSDSSEV